MHKMDQERVYQIRDTLGWTSFTQSCICFLHPARCTLHSGTQQKITLEVFECYNGLETRPLALSGSFVGLLVSEHITVGKASTFWSSATWLFVLSAAFDCRLISVSHVTA